MKKILFLTMAVWLLCSGAAWAQDKMAVQVSVTDLSGEPLPGATVVEVGTRNTATADVNGKCTITVPVNATLEVSFLGYTTQRVTATRAAIEVRLEESGAVSLDEAVVVGFSTQKKVNLTGSIGIATAKELESRPVSSATQALQGLVPGLKITTNTGQLGQSMSISVRGTGTIGAGSSGAPLILIDGMEGDINTVNPQDIENISVLKDAAASSIYGSRAPFGVILVTTKKGKEGKISVNYNNSFRTSSPINMPEAMDSYSFAVMMNYAGTNQGVGRDYTDETMQKMLDFQAGKLQYGLDERDSSAWEDRWTKGYANTDIWKETYKSSVFSQEHNVSASGGSEKMSYYASFNYLGQDGLIRFGDEGQKRYNATGKISATLTDWLKFNWKILLKYLIRIKWR